MTGPAEVVLVNATVHTMDARGRTAGAVAIGGGRILAVGAAAEVARLAGPGTAIDDLGGATVVPGFIDAHVHLDALGRTLGDAQLHDIRSVDAIVDVLRAHAHGLADGEPIVGRGECFHPSCMREGRLPGARDLDRVATDRIVAITDVEKTILNTRALEALALARAAPDPPGGSIGRDAASGAFDGVFYRAAKLLTPLGAQGASGSPLPLTDALRRAARELASHGVTGAAFPGAGPAEAEALQVLSDSDELGLRVTLMPPAAILDQPGAIERVRGACEASGGALVLGPLKVYYDGFIMHRTALMRDAYDAAPGERGASGMSADDLAALARRAVDAGMPLAVHVTGDLGLEQVVGALASAGGRRLPFPPHVIHAYLPGERTLERMARAGIAAAVQPAFVHAWGEALRVSIGNDRASRFLPLRTMVASGIACAGSSDGPIGHCDPARGIRASVVRLTAAGAGLGADEAIDVGDAIALYTRSAAALLGAESEYGSIEAGKHADLAVLARDPFAVPPADLADVRVVRTMLRGRTTFAAAGGTTGVGAAHS